MSKVHASKRGQMVKILRAYVKSELTEFLKAHRFIREKGDSLTYPYRRRLPNRHDLLEIQFSQYQTPKFKVNLGTVPSAGFVDWFGRLVAPDEARIYHLVRRAELCAYPFGKLLLGWFGIGCLSISPPEAIAAHQIRKLKDLFDQAELWFEYGVIGPNIRVIELPEYAPNALRRRMQQNGTWPPHYWTEKDEAAVQRAEALSGSGSSNRSE